MSYLLDSDIIIDFLYKKDPEKTLPKLIGKDLLISVITKAEVWYGIMKSSNFKQRSEEFLDLINLMNVTVIAIDEPTIDEYVNLKVDLEKKGLKIADFDLLIASTAIVKNLILVTRNKRHFSRISNLRFA